MSKVSKPLILGVTGVIGSGKSTLCRFLEAKHGFHGIDADKIVHKLYKNGKPGYQKIKDYFGKEFVGKREVHRGRLRQLILASPQKLLILNKLMHPIVTHEVNKKVVQMKNAAARSKRPLNICIEAVYFEPKDLGKFIDQLVVVDAPDNVILRRLKSRKIPERALRLLLKFQRKNMRSKTIASTAFANRYVLF